MKKFFYLLTSLVLYIPQSINAQNIISSTDTICVGGTITFTLNAANGICQKWYFSDDYSTHEPEGIVKSHQYNSAGTFWVSVTDNNSSSTTFCYDPLGTYYRYNIVVIDTAPGFFNQLPSQVCPNTTINFSTSSMASSYRWDFGDGSFSTQQNPDHKYTTLGTKNIQLVFYKPCGNDTISTTIDVINNLYPTIYAGDVTVNDYDTLICPGSKARFDFSTGSYNDHSYRWYFDDGDSSTFKDPTHKYNNSGFYNPMLILTNQCGLKDTGYTHPINVNSSTVPPPYVNPGHYGISYISDTLICPNTDIYFYYYSAADYSYFNYSFKWYFADGDSSTAEFPAHQYSTPGYYTPTLAISNTCGNTTNYTLPTIHVNNSFSGPLLQSWDYYITDNNWLGFDSICPNTPINFNGNYYNGLNYTWFFDNGDSANAEHAIYSYTTTGYYYPYLKTTNNCGITNNYYPAGFSISPNVHSNYIAYTTPDSICPGDSLQFYNYSTVGSPASSYFWHFGDGGSSTNEFPQYTYTATGVYTASLITTNGCAINDTTTVIAKAVSGTPPSVRFSYSHYEACVGDTITFTPNNINYNSYIWRFGDGTSSNAIIVKHAYLTPDDYTDKMSLVATNGCGLSDSLSFWNLTSSEPPLVIYDKLIVDAGNDRSMLTGSSTILGGNPIYTGQGQSINGYWTPSYALDDSLVPNPIATPTVSTTYYLHIINGGLCESVDSVTVHVQNTFAGTIFRNNYVDTVKAGFVYLIDYDTSNHVQMPTVDTAVINNDGTYSFGYVNQGKYLLYADASTTLYPNAVATYYGDTVFWKEAQIYNHTTNTNSVNISIKEYGGTAGPGRIAGIVVEGADFKMLGPGDPVKGIGVGVIRKPSPGIIQMTISDTTNSADSGKFEFKNLPTGNYELFVNITGVPLHLSFPTTTFTITPNDTVFEHVGIYVDSNLVSLAFNISGVKTESKTNDISVTSIYPNPASNFIKIEIDNYLPGNRKSDKVYFQFFDISGKVIETLQPFELYKGHSLLTVNTQNLNSGFYLLGIQQINDGEPATAKIISKVVIVR